MLRYCRSPLLCLFPIAAFVLMLCPTWLIDLQMNVFNANPMDVEFMYDVNKMLGTLCMIVSFVLMIPTDRPSEQPTPATPAMPSQEDDGSTEDTSTSLSNSCNRERCNKRQDNNNMSESDSHSRSYSQSHSQSHSQSCSVNRNNSRNDNESDSRSYSYNLRPNSRRMNGVSLD